MTRIARSVWGGVALLGAIAVASPAGWAQTPPPAQGRQQRPNPARQVPPAEGPLNAVAVQNLVDGWALVEAKKELELSEEQYPNFVTRMTRLQTSRRRHMMERQRTLRELRGLVFGAAPRRDELIAEKIKALDDLEERSSQEFRKLTVDLDGVLSPFQRGRFRIFEERIERQKLDMLLRVRQGRGGNVPR